MKKLISLIAVLAFSFLIVPYDTFAMDENGIGAVYYLNDFSTSDKVSEVSKDADKPAEYQQDGTMKMSQIKLYKLNFGTEKLPDININQATIEIKLAFKSAPTNWVGYTLGLYDGDVTTGARARLGYDAYNKTFKVTAVKDGAGEWNESLVLSNSISMNDWHKICMVTDNGNYDLYLDGKRITTQSLGLNSGELSDVTATNYMNNGNYCGAYIDDILVKETGTMALRDSSVEDNAVGVSVNTEKVELTFENPLTAESASGITVDGLTTNDYSVEIDQVNNARKAIITLNNTLEGSTSYTVNYNVTDYMGQTATGNISFTTETQVTPSEPEQTTVSVTPQNGAVNVNAYSPIVFTYNKNINVSTVPTELVLSNGKKALVTASGKTITVQPINPMVCTQSITVTLPDTIKDSSGETIPESITTYTTMSDSVYYEHIFRDRNNATQTKSEFPASQYLINDPGAAEDITGGNGLFVNNGNVTLIYKLDQGIDSVETMEYYGTSNRAGAGTVTYYISDVQTNIVSEGNIITATESIDEKWEDNKEFTKRIFKSDGSKKYFAVVVKAQNYIPQLQYLKFNQPKPETVIADIPTADGNNVTFSFNSRIDTDTVSADKFIVNGQQALSASVSGSRITLEFSALDYQKSYTVTAEGVTDVYGTPISELKFITPKAVKVISSGINEGKLTAQSKATAYVTVKNVTDVAQKIRLASAYYNGLEMKQARFITAEIGADEEKTIMLDPIDIDSAGENDMVKIFVWLDETMQPVEMGFEIKGDTND